MQMSNKHVNLPSTHNELIGPNIQDVKEMRDFCHKLITSANSLDPAHD